MKGTRPSISMRTAAKRVVVMLLVFAACFLVFIDLPGTGATASDPGGTCTSRVQGQGYIMSYRGPGGGTVTNYLDVTLEVSGGAAPTGTIKLTGGGQTKRYNVDGTFTGFTFNMHIRWGWDGVTNCDGYYALAVTDTTMKGTGSYLNVGATISGKFDLVKGAGVNGAGAAAAAGMVIVFLVGGIVSAIPAPTPIGPSMIAPTPISPTPIIPAPITPTPVVPTPVTPTPIAPSNIAPAMVTSAMPSEPHVRPADAPMQALPGQYPPGYPGPQGTWGTMQCPFCGMVTLSPMSDGWFCTNPVCPGRAGNAQGTLSRPWYHP
jgi:hypothetical protein